MTATVTTADVRDWAAAYDGQPFHALLCDPPYELGFMGRRWDASGVAFDPATWKALAAHLHPGAFGFAFASARGWHRLACAIEDAGLRLHPSIFGWAYGSGFPKATALPDILDGAYFTGHRYGLQALKPALEPILCFQKPYDGEATRDIIATGAGALNIDGGRLATHGEDRQRHLAEWERRQSGAAMHSYRGDYRPIDLRAYAAEGRWPANFVLTHHPDCNGACADGCPVATLNAQAGERGGGYGTEKRAASRGCYGNFSGTTRGTPVDDGDSGGASRFFHVSDWVLETEERLAMADPVLYCAKASRSERDSGLGGRNTQPTVKPIALTRWLATLLLPPGAYAPRRLLVPFSGSGSELIGAWLSGWEVIVAVEAEAECAAIAEGRLRYWRTRGGQA